MSEHIVDCSNLRECVREVLLSEKKRSDSFLNDGDIDGLLLCDDELCAKYKIPYKSRLCVQAETGAIALIGYPNVPAYLDLCDILQYWFNEGQCPSTNLPKFFMLNEGDYVTTRAQNFDSVSYLVEGLRSLWSIWNDGERQFRIREIFSKLGKRGLLDLLGIRCTVGSCDIIPPQRYHLYEAFQQLNKKGSALTVGARALAKHFHRDRVSKFWGQSTGTEAQKNEHAFARMVEILDGALWINLHQLPGEVVSLEVRQTEGYGVRWTADASTFRGFLEPQMEDGHEVGWKH